MSGVLSVPPSMSSHCNRGRNRMPSSPLIRIAYTFGAAHHPQTNASLILAVGSGAAASAWRTEGQDDPVSIDLQPIASEAQFDRIIAEAQQLEESFIVVWMAAWCRKCIYLKPKLEKLAVDYYPSIRFYCIDVNAVPQRLVNRAGILKMPTIQLWKGGMKQAEVIGVHKAWLVVNDVREMIEDES